MQRRARFRGLEISCSDVARLHGVAVAEVLRLLGAGEVESHGAAADGQVAAPRQSGFPAAIAAHGPDDSPAEGACARVGAVRAVALPVRSAARAAAVGQRAVVAGLVLSAGGGRGGGGGAVGPLAPDQRLAVGGRRGRGSAALTPPPLRRYGRCCGRRRAPIIS